MSFRIYLPLLVFFFLSLNNESFDLTMAEKSNCNQCQFAVLRGLLRFSEPNSSDRTLYEDIIHRTCADFLNISNCDEFRSDLHHFATFLLKNGGAKWACQLGGYCFENRTEAFREMTKMLGVFVRNFRSTKMFYNCLECTSFIRKINKNFYEVQQLVFLGIQRCDNDDACLALMEHHVIPVFSAIKKGLSDNFEYCSLLQECP